MLSVNRCRLARLLLAAAPVVLASVPKPHVAVICVPDAVQREALAERCSAGPGPFQTLGSGTVPGLQRTTKRCCAAPGTSAKQALESQH
jgi:hypothetical protein